MNCTKCTHPMKDHTAAEGCLYQVPPFGEFCGCTEGRTMDLNENLAFVIINRSNGRYAAKVGTWAGGKSWGFTTDAKQADKFQTYGDAIKARNEILATGEFNLAIEPAPLAETGAT